MVCTYSGEHRVNSCGKWLTSVENLKVLCIQNYIISLNFYLEIVLFMWKVWI